MVAVQHPAAGRGHPGLGHRPGRGVRLHPEVAPAPGQPGAHRALAAADLQDRRGRRAVEQPGHHVPAQPGPRGQRREGVGHRGRLPEHGVEAAAERTDDRPGGEPLAGPVPGRAAQLLQRGRVAGQLAEHGGQPGRVAGRHEDGRVAERGPLRRGVRGDHRAAGGGALVDLVRHHPAGLGPGAEDAEADVVPGDQLGQPGGRHPVQPLHPRVAGGQPLRLGPVLAAADHGHPHPRVAGQQPDRGADRRGALQRGEQPEEDHPQRVRVVPRAGRVPGGEPGRRRADRHHHHPLGQVGRHQPAVFLGVHHHDVGRGEREPVQPGQQPDPPGPGHAAVGRGVGGEDEVVEHQHGPAEQQPGQQHVEVAEVADQHRVRPLPAALAQAADGEHGPAAGQPQGQQRQPPGLAEHGHPAGGVDAEPHVDLADLVAAGAQPLDQDTHPRVRSDVVRPEREDPHAVRHYR